MSASGTRRCSPSSTSTSWARTGSARSCSRASAKYRRRIESCCASSRPSACASGILGRRSSRPGGHVLDPSRQGHAQAERRLRSEPIAWLTTVRADGQAQASPVWFLWDGETFLLYSQPGAQKVRNLAANPKVALHLGDDGNGGDVVSFEGTATVEPDGPRADRVDGYLAKYQAAIEALGYEPGPFARTYSLAIRVRPTRVRVS